MPSSLAMPSSIAAPAESHALHTIHATLRLTFGIVPIVAGLDKFTNLLVNWQLYLSPLTLHLLPVAPGVFMRIVGVIEIIAGLLVLAKPRLGGFVVMAWLLAIALQLVAGGVYFDVAVRDVTMSIGALTLARLTPLVDRRTV